MKLSHKLRVVIRHEYVTIVKQPSFWVTLVLVPLFIIAIGAFSYFSDRSSKANLERADTQSLKISVIDESGLIDQRLVTQAGATIAQPGNRQALINEVQSGKLDGLIVYPANVEQQARYQVYADNSSKNNADVAGTLGDSLLQRSVLRPIESNSLQLIALGNAQKDSVNYRNGEVEPGVNQMIVPGLFLVLFYIVLVFSVGYALTSVSDEKENRSIEMVLSYVRPQTLILGKLLAIIMVTLTQILYFIAVGAIAYGVYRLFGNSVTLPFGLNDLTLEPATVLFGLGFLLIGFTFFVGLMATIGAIFPSAKDAGSFSTIFFIIPALPFWLINTIQNQPDSAVTQVLTYVPLSSPTTALLRNTFGTLGGGEGLIALTILALSTVAVVMLAGKAFKLGTLEFNSRISLKKLLR